MIDTIYFLLFIAYGTLILGFAIREFTVAALAAVGLMVLGVHGIINGIAEVDNLVTLTISIVNIAIGFYVLVRGSIELLRE